MSAVLYKEQIALLQPILYRKSEFKAYHPKHFYLELQANVCSNSSLRKPVEA